MIEISQRHNINIIGKKVTILGLGRSGTSAAQLAQILGAVVFVSDPGKSEIVQSNARLLESKGINCEYGVHSDLIYDADLWVISPGVPKDSEIIQKALDCGVPVVGEIEFTSWYVDAPIIAVTGSNGKTTTVHALTEMCSTHHTHPILAGNMGIPFSKVVLEDLKNIPDPKRLYVLEISSFQMEFITHFKPIISVFLNLSPDHLDRYRNMDDYVDAKLNMFQNQSDDDYLIYSSDDTYLTEKISKSLAKKVSFSIHQKSTSPFYIQDDKVIFRDNTSHININDITLPGPHNLSNLLAAASAAHYAGVSEQHIFQVMREFTGVPHRLEFVKSVSDVTYVNDSKATNIDAVCVAVASYSEPVILILGGKYKGGDFAEVLNHALNLRTVVAYGEAKDIVEAALRDAVSLEKADRLKEAVATSYSIAKPGDVVLLSPGCSSFDQFTDFEDRGDQFKTWVNLLGES